MSKQILVIDDDMMVRRSIEIILAEAGYAVSAADSGVEGLKMFSEQLPHLVITDIIMPDKDGVEVILELRKIWPGPILAISGDGRTGRSGYLKAARRLGASATLAKPFEPS